MERKVISGYQDLEVWKKAIRLVKEIYILTRDFPKEEIYVLTAQIRRSAISVSSNIAEGWGRNMTKEYIQFLRISRGSLIELETQLIISKELGFLTEKKLKEIASLIQEISKMLNAMIIKLKKPI